MFCCGEGQWDTRHKALSGGGENKNPKAGTAYDTFDWAALEYLLDNPQERTKEHAFWAIFSSAHDSDARLKTYQLLHGSFRALALDIDKGNPSRQDLEQALANVLQGHKAYAWTTASATDTDRRWRVVIPLANAITAKQYEYVQEVLIRAVEPLVADLALTNCNQIIYLPIRGKYYESFTLSGQLLPTKNSPLLAQADSIQKQELSNSPARGERGYFNHVYCTETMLQTAGYIQKANTRHWRSPYQTSESYATRVWDDGGWSTRSSSDNEVQTLGNVVNGDRFGDSFDLYKHYCCQDNNEIAQLVARSLPYGWRIGDTTHPQEILNYYQETGAALIKKAYVNGEPISAEARAEMFAQIKTANVAVSVDSLYQNNTPEETFTREEIRASENVSWPPGVAGELARHIMRNIDVKIPQFAMATAFFILAGIAGRKYNVGNRGVENQGLNIYIGLVAGVGRGKSAHNRAAKTIVRSLAMEVPYIAEAFSSAWSASRQAMHKTLAEARIPLKAMYITDAAPTLSAFLDSSNSNSENLAAGLTTLWDSGPSSSMESYDKMSIKLGNVDQPSVSIGFDTQIESFKRLLGAKHLRDNGLISRFLIFIHNDKLPQLTTSLAKPMSTGLKQALINLCGAIPVGNQEVAWEQYHQPSPMPALPDDIEQADKLEMAWKESNLSCTAYIHSWNLRHKMRHLENASDDIYNIVCRSVDYANKIAALIAVANNPHAPTITKEIFDWAESFVTPLYAKIIKMMTSGEIGSKSDMKDAMILRFVTEYICMPAHVRSSRYNVSTGLAGTEVIPLKAFITAFKSRSEFQPPENSPLSYIDILKKAIENATMDSHTLREISKDDAALSFGAKMQNHFKDKLFIRGENFVEPSEKEKIQLRKEYTVG